MCKFFNLQATIYGSNTLCSRFIILTNSLNRDLLCNFADGWGPRTKASRSLCSLYPSSFNFTGTPANLYCRSIRLAGCFNSVTSVRSPIPRLIFTNSYHPNSCTNSTSLSTNSPNSRGTSTVGRVSTNVGLLGFGSTGVLGGVIMGMSGGA